MQKILDFKIPKYDKRGLRKVKIQQPEPGKVLSFQIPMPEPESILVEMDVAEYKAYQKLFKMFLGGESKCQMRS